MLKDNVINKKEFDEKMKAVKDNIKEIEEAIDDPKKMKELTFKLGIVNEVLPEVILMSDASKANPVEIQKQKMKEAKVLIRKVNADRKMREALKKQRDEEKQIKDKKELELKKVREQEE